MSSDKKIKQSPREPWLQITDFFRREPKKQRTIAAQFLASEDKDKWQKLLPQVQNPEFVRQLGKIKGVDPDLVLHAQSLHVLNKSPVKANIKGSTGKVYDVKKLPGGTLGCTCNDWRYKGSINPGYECKHIRAYKDGKVKVGMNSFSQSLRAFNEELEAIRIKKEEEARMRGGDVNREKVETSDLTADEDARTRSSDPLLGLHEPQVILGGLN